MRYSRGYLDKTMVKNRDVAGLIKILKDSQQLPGRWEAAIALGVIRDSRAVEPLIEALKERATELYGENQISDSARDSLAQIGGAAVEPLIGALEHSDHGVRVNAAEALGQIKDPRAVGPLMDKLKKLGWCPTRYLVPFGMASVEPLIVALKDRDAELRKDAAWALGEIGDARAVKPLIGALKDSLPEVRQRAAKALGQIKDAPAIKPLMNKKEELERASRHLAQLGRAAVESLIGCFKGRDTEVRRNTVEASANIGCADALNPLIDALKDRDSEVRQNAVGALGQIGDVRIVKPLIGVLKDSEPKVRRKAVEVLGQIADARTVKPLIGVLKDKDSEVRQKAIEALGPIADESTIEPLIGTLKDSDSEVRRKAATALVKFGPKVAGPLVGLLKDGNEDAQQALVQLGSAAVEPLIGALKHSDFEVCYRAAQSLGDIGDPRAVEPLIALLTSDSWAAGPLGSIGDARALRPLVNAIKRAEGGGPFNRPAAEWAEDVEPALKRLLERAAGTALTEHLRLVGTLNDFYEQDYVNGYKKVDCRHVKDMARQALIRR